MKARLLKIRGKRRNPFRDSGNKKDKQRDKDGEVIANSEVDATVNLKKYLDQWRDGRPTIHD